MINKNSFFFLGLLVVVGAVVAAQANEQVYIYSGQWGEQGSDDGQFDKPYGVAVDSSGYVYVGDSANDRIQKFAGTGVFVTKWGGAGGADGKFLNPYRVAVDSIGYVYVADCWNNRVQKFDYSGNFILKWGIAGSLDQEFNFPEGITLDSQNNVYVADRWNDRIQKFDSVGNFIDKWGSLGGGDSEFDSPYGIAVDSAGYVYVADTNNYRIQKFTSDGVPVDKWGALGNGNGQFNLPYGIAVDSAGYVYVADTNNYRIQKFDSNGNFIVRWGSQGIGDGQFDRPEGIVVDGINVYVADTENYRIQKFFRNYYPDSPGNMLPVNDTADLADEVTLSWIGNDPDPGDSLSYDVYFGTSPSPAYKTTQTQNSYPATALQSGTTYYWKIATKDDKGYSQESAVYRFVVKAAPIVIPPKLVVYPNPCKLSGRSAQNRIIFSGITGRATVEIYTLSGQKVRKLEKTENDELLYWDIRNEEGESLASGVYVYIAIPENGEKKTGKIAIVK
ncbi:MAG: T9SS type A sorting domain-containing protein [Elusimicrobiota bacterium]